MCSSKSSLWTLSTCLAIACILTACSDTVARENIDLLFSCEKFTFNTVQGMILFTAVASIVTGVASLFHSKGTVIVALISCIFCLGGQITETVFHLLGFLQLPSCQGGGWLPALTAAFTILGALLTLITAFVFIVILCRPIKSNSDQNWDNIVDSIANYSI